MTFALQQVSSEVRYRATLDGIDIGTVVVDVPTHAAGPMINVYGIAACRCSGRVFESTTPMGAAARLMEHARVCPTLSTACNHEGIGKPGCVICDPETRAATKADVGFVGSIADAVDP